MNIDSNNNNPVSSEIIIYKSKNEHLSITEKKIQNASSKFIETEENLFLNTYKALHLGGVETLESRLIRSTVCMTHTVEEMVHRTSNFNQISHYLNQLSNEQLSELLTSAKPLGSGTGGDVLSLEMNGVAVFIKKIRLTAIEEKNQRSTKNLFDLPSFYQYGVGSMGFGVWREVAALEMTTQWVIDGKCENFPLMYHSRVLQRSILPPPPSEEMLMERKKYIEYWDNSTAVGDRLEAAHLASSDVLVFMENIPQTLHKWIRLEGSNETLSDNKIKKLEDELNLVVAFMKSQGFLHFDAHFHNIMALNNHVYFADFGLATSQKFELSQEEKAFFDHHIDYDRYYIVSEIAKRIISATVSGEERIELLNDYLSPEKVFISGSSVGQRYRAIAILMNTFFEGLITKSKSTPYPKMELEYEWNKL